MRTNAFNRLPDALADTSLVESETDPSTHLAAREYHSDDEDSRLLVMAYIPGNQDDGYTPVTGSSDSRYLAVINRGFEALGAPENEIIERSPSIETYDWECYEALETQGGTFDHSFCITTGYGRVIEVQRLTVHGLDEQARNAHMDTVLEELSAALADLGS